MSGESNDEAQSWSKKSYINWLYRLSSFPCLHQSLSSQIQFSSLSSFLSSLHSKLYFSSFFNIKTTTTTTTTTVRYTERQICIVRNSSSSDRTREKMRKQGSYVALSRECAHAFLGAFCVCAANIYRLINTRVPANTNAPVSRTCKSSWSKRTFGTAILRLG